MLATCLHSQRIGNMIENPNLSDGATMSYHYYSLPWVSSPGLMWVPEFNLLNHYAKFFIFIHYICDSYLQSKILLNTFAINRNCSHWGELVHIHGTDVKCAVLMHFNKCACLCCCNVCKDPKHFNLKNFFHVLFIQIPFSPPTESPYFDFNDHC